MMNKMTFYKNFNWKSVVPHIVAVLTFLTLTLVYFSPALDGKDIKQDDAIGSMGWGKDARDYHEESGEYSYWSNAMFSGMPCNYTFSPQPENTFKPIGEVLTLNVFGASYRHIGCIFLTFIGSYILLLALGCKSWLSIAGSIVYTLGSYNFIIIDAGHMNKSLVIATMAPVIGGIILCYKRKLLLGGLVTLIFAGLNVYWSHQQVSYYLLLTVLIMAVVYLIYAYREKWLKYYFKATGVLAIVALLAIAPAAGILLPTSDYAKSSMRGGSEIKDDNSSGLDVDYAFAWSYGKAESFTLLVPNLYGSKSGVDPDSELGKYLSENYRELQFDIYDAWTRELTEDYILQLVEMNPGVSRRDAIEYIKQTPKLQRHIQEQAAMYANNFIQTIHTYWGEQPMTSGPVYVGAIVCFLFVLGLIIVRGPEKWWLLGATVFSLVLAWGSNLSGINNFLFEHMPFYNKFRAPSMALVITTLTMSTLAILAVKRFIESIKGKELQTKKTINALYIALGITGGITLLFAIAPDAFFNFTSSNDRIVEIVPDLFDRIVEERRSMFIADAWRSFGFIMAAAALMWAYTKVWFKFKNYALIGALGVLFLVDMWPVCKRFVNDDKFMPKKETTAIPKTDADRYIHNLEWENKYRVLDYTRGDMFNQAYTSYYHNSIGGYSPAKLARYQDIVDHYLNDETSEIGDKFFKRRERNIDKLEETRIVNMLNTKYIILGNKKADVIENPYAFGHCWFVDDIVWVDNANEEIAAIEKIDKQTAYIDKMWLKDVPDYEQYNNFVPGEIELSEYRNPGNIIYKSNSEAPKLAVFSEVYYKTWKAYIDGKEVKPIRANYILRALPIPAGEHTIEFKCVDELMIKSHNWSFYMSILVWLVIIGTVEYGIYRKVKK
ncbi:MAG: hypothetical protein IIW77_06565 [Bacteroidaceae bacterium]|nr:hypothetical protein [Bacteroidaceae bacterium]